MPIMPFPPSGAPMAMMPPQGAMPPPPTAPMAVPADTCPTCGQPLPMPGDPNDPSAGGMPPPGASPMPPAHRAPPPHHAPPHGKKAPPHAGKKAPPPKGKPKPDGKKAAGAIADWRAKNPDGQRYKGK